MGFVIYKLYNEKEVANNRIEELNDRTEELNDRIEELNGQISTIELKNENKKNFNNLNINSNLIQLLYEYIPATDTNKIDVNAYQNKEVTKESLSNKFLLEYAFRNLEILESQKEKYMDEMDINPGWYSFKAELLQNKVKEMYGSTLNDESFEIGYGANCLYKNGKYFFSSGGRFRKIFNEHTKDFKCI